MSRRELLLGATEKLAKELDKAVRDGQETFRSRGMEGFFAEFHKREYAFCPLYLLALYFETMTTAGVKKRAELERAWEEYSHDEAIQGFVRAVLQAEEGYHQLIAEIDELVKKEDENEALPASEICTVGSKLPNDLTFIDPASGGSVTLESVCKRSPRTLFVLMRHLA